MRVAVITCYRDPDYVRAITLRNAISGVDGIEMFVCKNTHKGLLRYPEVILKLIWLRITKRPDVYLITFRGYEILPAAGLLTWPKTLIFDEFINPLEWLNEARKERWAKFIPQKLIKSFYKLILHRSRLILADTPSHAKLSAELLGLPDSKFVALPVSTDEATFKPSGKRPTEQFTVFYYGSMLALHGLEEVFNATLLVKDLPIKFILAGGGEEVAKKSKQYNSLGANIEHLIWIPFDKLPDYIAKSSVCLAGPFGKTVQADNVITGKAYQFLASQSVVIVGENKASGDFVDKVNSLTVPLGDFKALAKQIKWAYNNPEKLPGIALKGRLLYDQKYSNNALSKQLTAIFEDL